MQIEKKAGVSVLISDKGGIQIRKHCKRQRRVFYCFFNWSIVDLQCCVGFTCSAEWFSYTYTYYINYFLGSFPYRLLQDIEFSSLCYTVGPCFSVLYVLMYICWSQTPNLPLSLPFDNHKFVFYVCESVSVL